jgi:hypothetical protein
MEPRDGQRRANRITPANVAQRDTPDDDPRFGLADGLSSDLWIGAAYQAGRSPAVSWVDVVELNPTVGRGGQTARLAAVTVRWLLRGRWERR